MRSGVLPVWTMVTSFPGVRPKHGRRAGFPPARWCHRRCSMRRFHLLADVAALGLAYQHQGGVTTKKFLREHPLVVRNFVKFYIEAVHRLKTDRALGLKIAAKYLLGGQGALTTNPMRVPSTKRNCRLNSIPARRESKPYSTSSRSKTPRPERPSRVISSMRASSKNSTGAAIPTACTGKTK